MLTAIYCPHCSYDLRGNRSERCPECGSPVHWESLTVSQLPWVHRKDRGRLRAYFQTLNIILQAPNLLAAELTRRVRRKDARRFAEISWSLGTIIGILMLMTAFSVGGGLRLTYGPWASFSNSVWWWPARALTDSTFSFLCIIPATALSWWVCMQLLRFFVVVGTPDPRRRRRLWVLSNYLWGIVPIQSVLLGFLLIGTVVVYDQPPWMPWSLFNIFIVLNLLFALLASGIYLMAVLQFLATAARASFPRLLLATFLVPVLQLAIWLFFWIATFWIAGYLTLAIWSLMT